MNESAMLARPRRSVLYMPGAKTRALEKARTLAADGLILDLEDAVAPAEKETARGCVAAAVKAGGYGGREVVIRINGLDTPWGQDDIAALAAAGADAILVPKVESAEQIAEVRRLMASAGAPEAMPVWAMMETPLAMLRAGQIAAAPGLACLVMGTNDLVKDLGAQHMPARESVAAGLGLCLLAGRAHGLAVLDGVYNAYLDEDGLRRECEHGRAMGFDGKTLIHPAQLSVTNAVFGPSEDEIALARRQVTAFAEAEAAGQGIAVVDGRIVENLHVEMAHQLLARAEAIAALEQGNAA